MSAEKDLERARKKAIPEDKMRELLVKARKGATASFTLGKLVQILDRLGWTIEPIYGWTPLHYQYQNEEQLVNERSGQNPRDVDIAAFEQRRQQFIDASVDELPEAGPGTVGKHVIMDVGPMKTGYQESRYFSRREWVGTEGVKIASPRGEEVDILPDHHDWSRGEKSATDSNSFASSEAWRFLKPAGIEDDIGQALGMEKHIPASERTRENTGTCAHCWGNYKLEGGRLVLHGYKRPRWGYVIGKCHGVGYEPLEKTSDGAEDQLKHLVVFLADWEKKLSDLQSGRIIELTVGYNNKKIRKGEHLFEHYLENEVHEAKRTVKQIESEIELYKKVLSAWRERPMPKSGELQRGPGFFTK